jgi:hypothetical protein
MKILGESAGKGTFELVSAGWHKAKVKNTDTKTGPSHRGFDIYFTIADEGDENGRNIRLRDFVNYDPEQGGFTYKKTSLLASAFEVFSSSLGKSLSEIDPEDDLKGIKCMIEVTHVKSEDGTKTYANVTGIKAASSKKEEKKQEAKKEEPKKEEAKKEETKKKDDKDEW